MEDQISVFYSWQSGPYDKENRYLIGGCLQEAARQLAQKGIVVRIDQDTRDTAGSADIPQAVFQKIEAADFFVGDLSIINPDADGARKTPNPNVLIELGYAAHALGWERIACVFNTRFGKLEDAPFDIRHRRMLAYDSAGALADVKKRLTAKLLHMISGFAETRPLQCGNPLLAEAKASLAKLLLEGIRYAWDVLKEQEDASEEQNYIRSPESEAPIVLSIHRQQAGLLEGKLEAREYARLDDMLDMIQKMRHGTEDAYGWEYARTLADYCFEPVWLEYKGDLAPLPAEKCLRREIVQLLDRLLEPGREIPYEELRVDEAGRPVFSSAPTHIEVYQPDGETLVKADLDEKGRITGWKREYEYRGEFAGGVRHGEGTEYYHTFHGHGIRLSGRWEHGKFVAGTIYNAVLSKDDTAEDGFAYETMGDGDFPMQLFDENLDALIRELMPDECSKLFSADMLLHDGLYDIIGTPVPLCPRLGGEERCACYDCPKDDA